MNQEMLYSEQEVSLMRNTFLNKPEILKAIRKVFLQIRLSKKEDAMIGTLGEDVLAVLKRLFLPNITGDEPTKRVMDFHLMLEIDQKLPEDAILFMDATEKIIEYMRQQFNLLEGKGKKVIRFNDFTVRGDKTDRIRFVDMLARNQIIGAVEGGLSAITGLASQKIETPEEIAKRIAKDSSK